MTCQEYAKLLARSRWLVTTVRTQKRDPSSFLPNLQNHRFWLEEEKRFVQLRVSTKGIRLIDKKGIEVVVAELRARGEKV